MTTTTALDNCPARIMASVTGAKSARTADEAVSVRDGVRTVTATNVHEYVRGTGCTACGPAVDPLAAALAEVTPSREPGDTITLTRAALVDLLTTAATLGHNANGSTRGDFAAYLGTYGFRVDSPRLDQAVASAITATA